MAGDFETASETLAETGEAFDVVFFDRGSSYFRLSPIGKQLPHTVAVVARGREIARYASSWDRFAATPDGHLFGIPMDTRLVSGAPYPPIEKSCLHDDEHYIDSLRHDGVDVSKPLAIEFGFWFPTENAAAKAELLSLGCRWLTAAERHGTIGPYPSHCLKRTALSPASLAVWHARFTRLAQSHGGKYYGWNYPD
jgi:hypothetical protein